MRGFVCWKKLTCKLICLWVESKEVGIAEDNWRLEQISDFFYLLVDGNDRSGKNILQKRFKKELDALNALYDLIEKVDELGYRDGIDFAFNTNRFDTIRGTRLSLIEIREIRRFNKTWRVITYWSKRKKAFVMLDAFEAHRSKDMSEMLKQVKPLAKRAVELIEEGE